jgi:hypothetical protein
MNNNEQILREEEKGQRFDAVARDEKSHSNE